MLIENYRKPVKQYFWWQKLIEDAIVIARKEQKAKRHAKNRVGIDDPTGDFVERKNMPLRNVVIYVRGKKVVIEDPEKWIEIIKATYALYSRQPISGMIRERIETKKTVEVLSGFMGISKETFHRWENEFFDDAAFLAAKAGLYQQKNNKKTKSVTHF